MEIFRRNGIVYSSGKFHSSTIVGQYEKLYYEVAGEQ